MNENNVHEIEGYKLYLEKISAVIHVPPEIGAILYIAEWYMVYGIVYLMSGSWVMDTNTFERVDVIPFFLAPVVGWGSLYVKRSYINTSKELEFLLDDSSYKELSNKMVRRWVVAITYVSFALFAIVCAVCSFFGPDGTSVQYGLAGQIFMVHNLLWYLVIGIPVLAELVSLLFGVVWSPHLISKGVLPDAINAIEPYRCGGLRPIGELCFSGGVVYFLGLTLYTVIFYNLPIMNILVAIMWVVGFSMFVAPQYYAYKLLRDRKRVILKEITSQIHEENKIDALINGRATEGHAIRLFSLMILFTEVEKMRVCPFDLKASKEFLFVAVIPIVVRITMILFI